MFPERRLAMNGVNCFFSSTSKYEPQPGSACQIEFSHPKTWKRFITILIENNYPFQLHINGVKK